MSESKTIAVIGLSLLLLCVGVAGVFGQEAPAELDEVQASRELLNSTQNAGLAGTGTKEMSVIRVSPNQESGFKRFLVRVKDASGNWSKLDYFDDPGLALKRMMSEADIKTFRPFREEN